MTDRVKGLVVVLEEDMRTDDVENVIRLICTIKGVLSVENNIVNPDDYINRERVRIELVQKLWSVLKPDSLKGKQTC
jgi:hypothetical protein